MKTLTKRRPRHLFSAKVVIGEEKLDLGLPIMGGCLRACPDKGTGAPCLKTCTLSGDHYGPHKCPDGHRWG